MARGACRCKHYASGWWTNNTLKPGDKITRLGPVEGVGKMKSFLAILVWALLAVSAPAQRPAAQVPVRPQQQTFDTSAGPVKITPIYHATVLIETPGVAIYVDPAKPAPLDDLPTAQLILITDIHPDHMDPDALFTLGNTGVRGTQVIGPTRSHAGRQVRQVDQRKHLGRQIAFQWGKHDGGQEYLDR